MADVHQFAYGWFTPVVAAVLAFLGCLLGLVCTTRARTAGPRRSRWLTFAAISLGGSGFWVMHFTALIGFDVPVGPVRYDALTTIVSLLIAVVSMAVGLFIVAGHRSTARLLSAGVLTGVGLTTMHYTGLAGIRLAGTVGFDRGTPAAVGLAVAVGAATASLWCAMYVTSRWAVVTGAVGLAAAAGAAHYTAMAGIRVTLRSEGTAPVPGLSPFTLLLPVLLLALTVLIAVAFNALQAMTEADFAPGAVGPVPLGPVPLTPLALTSVPLTSVPLEPVPLEPVPLEPVPNRNVTGSRTAALTGSRVASLLSPIEPPRR